MAEHQESPNNSDQELIASYINRLNQMSKHPAGRSSSQMVEAAMEEIPGIKEALKRHDDAEKKRLKEIKVK